MNITYLNTLPEVENKFNIKLQDGEKVILLQNLLVLELKQVDYLEVQIQKLL